MSEHWHSPETSDQVNPHEVLQALRQVNVFLEDRSGGAVQAIRSLHTLETKHHIGLSQLFDEALAAADNQTKAYLLEAWRQNQHLSREKIVVDPRYRDMAEAAVNGTQGQSASFQPREFPSSK